MLQLDSDRLGDIVDIIVMDTNCIHTRGEPDITGLCARCEDALHDYQHPVMQDDCFACKVSTIGLQFTYGKEDFKGPTIGERQEQQYAECKRDGVDIAPVQKLWS